MNENFDPSKHRENYEAKKEKVDSLKEQITGDKSAEDFTKLIQERQLAIAELKAEYANAEEAGHEDNDRMDMIKAKQEDLRQQIEVMDQELAEVIGPKKEYTPESFIALLESLNIEAKLDTSIEGGIFNIELDQKTIEALQSYQTAIEAYDKADGTPTYIYEPLKNIPWTPPQLASLNIHILNHGETTPAQRDQLVLDMDKAGYRVLTFSELVALGIERPDLNKRKETLITYEKHTLVGESRVPLLSWDVDERCLHASWDGGSLLEHCRFLFVRK